jgi:hypothetical protein
MTEGVREQGAEKRGPKIQEVTGALENSMICSPQTLSG